MRVPLKVENIAGGLKPILYATLRIPQFHIYRPIRFVIDTGSPQSAICEKDALIMQIPFNRIRKSIRVYGIGGSSVEAKPIKRAVITFRNEEGGLEHRTLPVIYACRTTKRDMKTRSLSQSLPSILGVDFLIDNRFRLVFDPVNLEAYLEEV